MTLGFLSGSKNFCKLLCVPCEVFVLHGYDWIHWMAMSCTTIVYRWLFRGSQLSLRTLWSAVMKSPKFSARGTASPLRLLHGVFTLCLPKSSLLLDVESEDASWQELACEFLCSGTLSYVGSKRRWLSSKQRVSPFYHLFNIRAWHKHWMGIDPTQISLFSSRTVT